MSKANTAEALGGTRELLDELDALMDQMLALPIAEQDTAGGPSSPPGQPPATISATLTMLDSAPADSAEDSSPFSASASEPCVEPPTNDEVAPIPLLSDVAAPRVVEPLRLPARPHTARWRPDDITFQFLLWVNQRYDRSTTWLGRFGGMLRGRWARACLGLGGLVLLGVALCWLCKDLMGWNW